MSNIKNNFQSNFQSKRAGTARDISEIYGLNPGTLANMRSQRTGPLFVKRGRSVIYFLDDVESWLRSGSVKFREDKNAAGLA